MAYRRYYIEERYVDGVPTGDTRVSETPFSNKLYPTLEECETACTEEERWVETGEWICEGTTGYHKLKRQIRCGTDQEWTDVYPYEYKKDSQAYPNSSQCGYEYKEEWREWKTDCHHDTDEDGYCTSAELITWEKKYVSTDGGTTWEETSETREKSKIEDSPSCGYATRTRTETIGGQVYEITEKTYCGDKWWIIGSHIAGGQLYYLYNDGTESYYDWNNSTLRQTNNNGMYASVIIDYGSKITLIESNAFVECSDLQSISFPMCESVGHHAFSRCINLQTADLPLCTYIGEGVFYQCGGLQSVNLPMCTSISSHAFGRCRQLQSIDLPLISVIDTGLFSHCSQLQTVNIPNCTLIKSEAFSGCSSLQSIECLKCSAIQSWAFANCHNLQTVNLPICVSVSSIAFQGCSNLQSVNLPMCSHIGYAAFKGCASLQSIDLPLCESILSGTFSGCTSLQSVNLPMCSNIGSQAFKGCASLQSIDLPLCTSIGISAFDGCISLQTVSLSICSYIGSTAFCSCSNLKDIYLGYSKSYCSFYAPGTVFSGCPSDLKIHVPSSLYSKYRTVNSNYRVSTYPSGSVWLMNLFVSY